jgi:hypothetical protein
MRARGQRRGFEAARLQEVRVRIPPGGTDISLVSVMCLQIDVSASSSSLVQWSPIECGVSECDRVVSIMRRSWLTGGSCTVERGELMYVHICEYLVLVIIILTYCNCQLLSFHSNFVKNSD